MAQSSTLQNRVFITRARMDRQLIGTIQLTRTCTSNFLSIKHFRSTAQLDHPRKRAYTGIEDRSPETGRFPG